MTTHIPTVGAYQRCTPITLASTPYSDGRPDPRTETEPPRGIISRRATVTPAQVVEIIRRELVQWRAAQ